MLLGGLAPLPAAAEPVSYHLRRVTVRGGNPIHGVEGGVVFERPGEPCEPATTALMKPMAASLRGDVSLELEIGACPAGSPPPSLVRCAVQVADRPGPPVQFAGWQGSVPIVVPNLTFSYGLGLGCSISGQTEELGGTLYLTYQPPREPVKQPFEDWYRLACRWGAGLTAAVSEPQVVESILHGLYDQGQRVWRYGYCTVEPGGNCRFGETTLPIDSPSLEPLPKDSPTLGRCKWSALAAGDPKCNFTDCYGFSDLLHYIAATMGVGGLADEEVRGALNRGFGTQGWLRAIDSAALGNLECGYRNLPCSFLFSVHDLRKRDGVSYDATYGRLYTHAGELVANNILGVVGSFIVILDHQNACFVNGPHYGAFSPLREVSKALLGCPKDARKPAVFVDPSAGSEVFPAGAVGLRSVEGDAKPELLSVQLIVEVLSQGSYSVYSFLSSGPEGNDLAVNRPGQRVTAVWPHAHVSGSPGRYPVTLSFSGEDVARASGTGSLWLNAVVVGPGGISGELRRKLPSLPLAGLGEQHARLGEISEAARVVFPDGATALRVRIPVAVRDTGSFAVDARLASGGKTLAYSGFRRELTEGEDVLTIEFPGEEIARRGIDGLYEVTVELHLLDPDTGYPLELTDSAMAKIGTFNASDFQSAQ